MSKEPPPEGAPPPPPAANAAPEPSATMSTPKPIAAIRIEPPEVIPVRALLPGYGSILDLEADGTPPTEVRSRTRTWRRWRIVLLAQLAGGAALLPRSTNESRRSRHRRPNRSSRPGLEAPVPGQPDFPIVRRASGCR